MEKHEITPVVRIVVARASVCERTINPSEQKTLSKTTHEMYVHVIRIHHFRAKFRKIRLFDFCIVYIFIVFTFFIHARTRRHNSDITIKLQLNAETTRQCVMFLTHFEKPCVDDPKRRSEGLDGSWRILHAFYTSYVPGLVCVYPQVDFTRVMFIIILRVYYLCVCVRVYDAVHLQRVVSTRAWGYIISSYRSVWMWCSV